MKDIYQKIFEALLEESELQEMNVSGAVVGVAAPLGAGPAGRVNYKTADSTDKDEKEKSKKRVNRKHKSKSPSFYIQNGPSK
jgi:hypothetical protein